VFASFNIYVGLVTPVSAPARPNSQLHKTLP